MIGRFTKMTFQRTYYPMLQRVFGILTSLPDGYNAAMVLKIVRHSQGSDISAFDFINIIIITIYLKVQLLIHPAGCYPYEQSGNDQAERTLLSIHNSPDQAENQE
ncbi:hypothetical protein SDC9_152040 [bioreactor metagenome]|uniref:Uncharacterized protein n=1 Tax=bioreactor metagenome TaxID=1076179 RepID=A0A645EU94_9ZZZZ